MGRYFLAIDLGGTNTKIGIVDKTKGLLEKISVKTPVSDGPKKAAEAWLHAAEPWFKKYTLTAIGIGSPGPLERSKGWLHKSPNLPGWEKFSFTEFLRKKTGLAVSFDKDATVAALGEWQFGDAKGLTDFVVVTLGTGIGTGVVSSGKVIRGTGGYAPEIGHMVVQVDGPKCNCGRSGCLEAFLGAGPLLARGHASSMAKLFEEAQQGNPESKKLVDNWIKILALGLGNIVNIFNPQKIILTGGVSASWTFVEKDLKKILLHEAFEASLKCCEIVASKLGNDGALLGAAHLAQMEL